MQSRVGGACALATYLRGINADGSLPCSDLPGATSLTIVDDPENNVGQHTPIAIGSDGPPVLSYYDASAFKLKVAKYGTRSCQ